jgi:hypothetical protein
VTGVLSQADRERSADLVSQPFYARPTLQMTPARAGYSFGSVMPYLTGGAVLEVEPLRQFEHDWSFIELGHLLVVDLRSGIEGKVSRDIRGDHRSPSSRAR